jgi:hypothetical protein
MSQDFIEFTFPCSDCLVAAACRERKDIKKKDLVDQDRTRCLALRAFDPKTSSYQKSFLEQMANITWRFACELNEDRDMKIPEQYRHFLIEYLGIFQYIINTTSWRENLPLVEEFDKDEVKRKLNTAKTWLR